MVSPAGDTMISMVLVMPTLLGPQRSVSRTRSGGPVRSACGPASSTQSGTSRKRQSTPQERIDLDSCDVSPVIGCFGLLKLSRWIEQRLSSSAGGESCSPELPQAAQLQCPPAHTNRNANQSNAPLEGDATTEAAATGEMPQPIGAKQAGKPRQRRRK
jgi:hypothetical protein